MKLKVPIAFWIILGILAAGLIGIFVYFIVNCVEIAKTHTEPQADIALLLFILGSTSALVLTPIKYFRNNKYWYLISLLFIFFALLLLLTIASCPICAQF